MNCCIKSDILVWDHRCWPCWTPIIFFCNAFLVPKFCHCEELSAMPPLFKASTSNVSCQSPSSCPSFHAVAILTLYQLLFKNAGFLQKCLFLYKNKKFCSTLYHGSPLLWTKYVADTNWALKLCQLLAVGLQTLLCRVHLSHQSEIQSFVCRYRGASCTYCLGTMWCVRTMKPVYQVVLKVGRGSDSF